MSIVVFAGPSVSEADVHAHASPADIRVVPPVRRGDIDALFASADPPTRVGIIDGEFLQGLSISPKEILRAMDTHAAPVFYGASSIGALRAVELADYGMVGIGRIVELYSTGQVVADDEVAVTFDSESGVALSEPLVNVRIALTDAVAQQWITATTADTALAISSGLYFPERTYQRILKDLDGNVSEAELRALRDYLEQEAPDAKRSDALSLVSAITRPSPTAVTGQ